MNLWVDAGYSHSIHGLKKQLIYIYTHITAGPHLVPSGILECHGNVISIRTIMGHNDIYICIYIGIYIYRNMYMNIYIYIQLSLDDNPE